MTVATEYGYPEREEVLFMNEYGRVGASFYDFHSLGVEGDVQFYLEEARKAHAPVLEIGCGTGRILLPIAQAGAPVVGLDRSADMLAVLRQKLARLGPDVQARVELFEGDMRDFSLDRQFKLITIPYRAFLHLLTPKAQRQALECIREHLADDGHLILNIFDPSLEMITSSLGLAGVTLKRDTEFIHPETGNQVIVWYTGQYDPEVQLLTAYFIFEEIDKDGKVIQKTYNPLSLRYVYRYEMRYLLELSGYKVESLYGDFQRGPFRYGGERIWVVRKA
ncbi:MAG: class I SAM-dependent methyltransferase [Deltaproteobacteria bacterium]|nr:class I SAM-dependent methyltransferase [Deltaproteobacteria bacterium]